MAPKTWFLPPDFSLLPDGELALGTVIPHPSRPTLALACLGLDSDAEIALPDVKTIVERNHCHTAESSWSIGAELSAKFIDLASASGKVDISRFKKRSFGTVDHEVRSFNGHVRPESLQAITELAKVKKHINGGRFGKRPVYIVSGLQVARDSFTVIDEIRSTGSASLAVSGTASVPLEAAAGNSGSRESKSMDGYDTAPGVVFAYRLHVIRDKRSGDVDSELFSHRTAFLTGEGDDDEGQEELEMAEVTAEVVNQDLEVEPDFDECTIGSDSYVVFRRKV